MTQNRGIFESFPKPPSPPPDSPFAVVPEPAAEAPASPFAAMARRDSPFTVIDETSGAKAAEAEKSSKLPERRKLDSPFQIAEPAEGFGFEAPAKPHADSPFQIAPAAAPTAPAPFSATPQAAGVSPFSVEPEQRPSPATPATQAAIAAFGNWQEPPAAVAAPAPVAAEPAPSPAFAAAPQLVPSAFSPAPQAPAQPAHGAAPAMDASQSDSFSIRQLELRAIFGMDREMSHDEILQRARTLPGMKNVARVGAQDMATVEALKNLLPSLGFGSGGLKLYAGSVPLEFIREGPVLLAVQTDGGFAPGVRETLMIVARELGRSS
jgi:hypothetical protein